MPIGAAFARALLGTFATRGLIGSGSRRRSAGQRLRFATDPRVRCAAV
jgi:hypothetical protein